MSYIKKLIAALAICLSLIACDTDEKSSTETADCLAGVTLDQGVAGAEDVLDQGVVAGEDTLAGVEAVAGATAGSVEAGTTAGVESDAGATAGSVESGVEAGSEGGLSAGVEAGTEAGATAGSQEDFPG